MKLLPYVLRNVRRNKLRSLLTIMAIAMCLMLMTFLYGYLESMEVWGREAEKYNRVVVMNSQGFAGQVPLKMLDEVREMDGVVAATPFSWFGGKYGDGTEFFAQFGTDPDRVFDVWSEFKIPPEQLAEFKTGQAGLRRRSRPGQAPESEDRRPGAAARNVLPVRPRSEARRHLRSAGDGAQPVLQPEVPRRGAAAECRRPRARATAARSSSRPRSADDHSRAVRVDRRSATPARPIPPRRRPRRPSRRCS